MSRVELAALDLNLLVVLDALLAERHVTRAARRAHLSQPAASRALARLRRLFDDPLLVRMGQRTVLTPKAEALVAPLAGVLDGARALMTADRFDPRRARGTVRLALPDVIMFMLGPALIQRVQREAPDLDIDVVQWSIRWRDLLAGGEVDLTVGDATPRDRGIFSKLLVRNDWTTVLRREHPALRRRWTLETFLSLRHLLIGFTSEGGGHVDAALAPLALRRRVAVRMPYVVLSPLIVAETDLVLTTAKWLANKFAAPHGLVLRPPPKELGLTPVDLPMVWHERTHRDPKQRWVRTILVQMAEDAGMVRASRRVSAV